MHLIKKYANRKLYHTNRKQYITLDGIGELIQRGEEVRVTDNESGDDITASILAQVVLQARGRKSALPTHLLTDMIQAGSGRLADISRSVWTVFGGMSPVDDEIMQRIQHLQDEGMIDAAEAARMQQLLIAPQPEQNPTSGFATIPTTSDIARLNAQVDALTGMVEQLLAERAARQPNTEA